MKITFKKNELTSDIRSLEGKGINTEVAKELAEFKRIIDCAANTWYDLCAADEDNLPEDVYNAFDYAHSLLENAYFEVEELFPE